MRAITAGSLTIDFYGVADHLFGMQITWLDVLAGNIGAAFLIAGILFAYRDWRTSRHPMAGYCCWALTMLALGIFTYRAGCWSGNWACS